MCINLEEPNEPKNLIIGIVDDEKNASNEDVFESIVALKKESARLKILRTRKVRRHRKLHQVLSDGDKPSHGPEAKKRQEGTSPHDVRTALWSESRNLVTFCYNF